MRMESALRTAARKALRSKESGGGYWLGRKYI